AFRPLAQDAKHNHHGYESDSQQNLSRCDQRAQELVVPSTRRLADVNRDSKGDGFVAYPSLRIHPLVCQPGVDVIFTSWQELRRLQVHDGVDLASQCCVRMRLCAFKGGIADSS